MEWIDCFGETSRGIAALHDPIAAAANGEYTRVPFRQRWREWFLDLSTGEYVNRKNHPTTNKGQPLHFTAKL